MNQLEPGTLQLTVHITEMNCYYPRPQHVHIDQADPVIWVDGHIMDEIRRDQHNDGYPITIEDDLITVTASNRTVIYCIKDYDALTHRYLCAWPD
jgi:hypothetical protein